MNNYNNLYIEISGVKWRSPLSAKLYTLVRLELECYKFLKDEKLILKYVSGSF